MSILCIVENTITNSEKKGGRYTKKELEERRLQVYDLHFEQKKSAVEIAKLLHVNRNTITDDIKYWHQTNGDDISFEDVARKLKRQLLLPRIQRSRLLEYLEDAKDNSDILKIEKSISDIDREFIKIILKMSNSKKSWILSPKENIIDENEIKVLVRNLILSNNNSHLDFVYTQGELIFNFIKAKTCDESYAYDIFYSMQRLGLNQCKIKVSSQESTEMLINPSLTKFSLLQFAILRNYLNYEELELIQKKLKKVQMFTN